MNELDATRSIQARFLGQWDAQACPVLIDNVSGKPPATGKWCRLAVRWFDGPQHTLGPEGDRRFRRSGSIFVQCFGPADGGVQTAMQLAIDARDVFEGKSFDGVECFATSLRTIGNDRAWFNVNAETPVVFDEVR